MEYSSMEHSSCHSCDQKPRRVNRLWIISILIGTIFCLGFWVPVLRPLQTSFLQYLKLIWWAVGIGLLLGGLIERYVPQVYVSQILARPGGRTILNAVLLGFLMSACSHGILALSMELHKKGASGPAVVSFLLASPWANLPLTILLIVFFGVQSGLAIILCAVFVALATGFFFLLLDARGLIEQNPNTVRFDAGFSIQEDLRRRWRARGAGSLVKWSDVKAVFQGAWALADMILWWILTGVFLASIVSSYVPVSIFQQYLGPTLLGLLATLGIATVLEVCSEGTAPLSFEIYEKTQALGNSFVFLMGGVVTDYTEIGLVWHNIGKKTAMWMVAASLPWVILLGLILNHFG
jgi:uncharacterized protein